MSETAAKTRVGMISLGCPKNLVDAEIMLGQLQLESEVELTQDLEAADVVIVNTCGFIDAAKQESIDTILEIADRKKNGVRRLVVSGCMVQKYRSELQEAIPEIDAFVGLDHLEAITAAVTGAPLDDAAPVKRKMSVRLYEDLPRVLTHGTQPRVPESLRRLLESLHVLRDPADARQVPQPHDRLARARGEAARERGRQGALPHRAGHHAVRPRTSASSTG